MKDKIPMIARLLLGLIFFVFGLNGFLMFMPPPPNMPEASVKFFMAMMETKYFLPTISGTQVLVGVMLLTGVFSPVALLILAPITIQIILFHIFLTPGFENLVIPLIVLVLHLTAAKGFWHLYRPLFIRRW